MRRVDGELIVTDGSGRPGRIVTRSTPAILWLLHAQGLGQLVGYLLGPGDSPHKVQ